MSIEKPILKLYNTDFTRVALIDDYQQAQIEHNLYSAGAFSISINYNIPNARLFQRGLFIQFGNNARDFCVIQSVENSIGSSGKGSEYITVSGYDCRYLFKRRIIKNLNSNDTWSMTAKGELCICSLVADQCGVNAEEKRKLPITNIIPNEADAIGSTYSVSEAYSNLYDTLVTIATQSEIGWAVEFNGSSLNLVVYQGENKSSNVFFSTDFESLANGKYKDSNDSYSNSVYIGGKGTGSERDIYEGEVDEPEGLERFESYDDQSSMTTEEEYEEKARSILSQYGQTITVSGVGLAKCPYVFREQYDIGDVIKLSFSGKSANTQILSVSESWVKGSYSLSFNFGKPVNTLSDQLNIMLRKIQDASNKSSATTSVKWYNLPDDTEQDINDVTFNTLGFTGEIASGGSTFTLGFNSEGVGCKTYIIYVKNLTGSDELTLTTGTDGAENITFNQGTYIATVTVDTEGNVIAQSVTEAAHAITADTATNATNAVNADTATNATNVNIVTSDANGDFPLLFSASVTAGNKRVYTDTANNGSYNPSTNDMKISGNVLGSNLPYVSQVYSASNYNSGYFLLAQLEGGANGDHDIGIIGSVIFGNTSLSSRKTDFEIFARGKAQTISITKFVVNGTAPIIATYEAVATNKFIIRLYGQISAYYQRFITVINLAFIGDVYGRTSNRNVTFPNTRVTSVTGTQITKTNYPTLIETSLPSSPQNGQIWIS